MQKQKTQQNQATETNTPCRSRQCAPLRDRYSPSADLYQNTRSPHSSQSPLYTPPANLYRTGAPAPMNVQPRLTIGGTNNAYERQAEAVATRVMQKPAGPALPPVAISPLGVSPVQRLCQNCAEEEQGHIQPLRSDASKAGLSYLHQATASQESGSPLPRSTRSRIEPVVARDLSHARVHSSPLARQAASSIGARAFTHGHDIYLGRGESTYDLRLMAHEATHVVQQTGDRVHRFPNLGLNLGVTDYLADRRDALISSGRSLLGEATGLLPEGLLPENLLDVAALTGSPMEALVAIRDLLENPVMRRAVLSLLSENIGRLLDLDDETLGHIDDFLADPQSKVHELTDGLEPHIAAVPGIVDDQARELLTAAGLATAPFLRVLDEIGNQLGMMASEWRSVVYAILIDTFVLWDWSQQAEEIQDINRRYLEAGTIDTFDWYLGMIRVVLGGLDRILGAIDIILFAISLFGGTAAGATGGGAVAGVGGGVATAGVGAAPAAAGGTAVGGGAGAAAGTTVGATIHAFLSGFSIGANIGVESIAILKAAHDLRYVDQNEDQIDEDYRQIASSIITLGIILGLIILGPIAARIGKTLAGRLKRLAPPLRQRGSDADAVAPPTTPDGGTAPTRNLDPNRPANQLSSGDLGRATQTRTRIGGVDHNVSFRRRPHIECEICSKCGRLTDTLDQTRVRDEVNPSSRDSIDDLAADVRRSERRIDEGATTSDAADAAARHASDLQRLAESEPALAREINAREAADGPTTRHEFNESGRFRDSQLEDAYQAYLARKRRQRVPDNEIRGRAEWREVRDYWLNDSPMARGNQFNRTRADAYPFNEVHLANGYRLDSYRPPPPRGEIVSRKASDFGSINEDTFRRYVGELPAKYGPGTPTNSAKYDPSNLGSDLGPILRRGEPLQGDLILEVPDSNLAPGLSDRRARFEAIAAEQDVTIRYVPE